MDQPQGQPALVVGCDGGLYVSYDRGANWDTSIISRSASSIMSPSIRRRPYHVYGGLQDNGSWGGPSNTLRPSGPTNADCHSSKAATASSAGSIRTIPTSSIRRVKDGNMFRRNLRTGEGKSSRPKMRSGASKFRFNWNTPFILSHHNSHIFYAGGNYVFRSVKQGDDLQVISPEITRTKHGTATALAESPKTPDVLWAGTDDGAVWVTRDGGKTWTDVSANFKSAGLPGPRWVASIEAVALAPGRCYVVFDAHRSDDDEPYVFVTEDFGQTWKSLRGNLPIGSTRVLREDMQQSRFALPGHGVCRVCIDQSRRLRGSRSTGRRCRRLPSTRSPSRRPRTRSSPRTHGRSLWVLDVTTLRQLRPDHWKQKPDLFAPAPVTGAGNSTSPMKECSAREPAISSAKTRRAAPAFDFVLAKKAEKLSLKIFDPVGGLVRELDVAKDRGAGLHRVAWDLVAAKDAKPKTSFTPYGQPVKPGIYRVLLTADGVEHTRVVTIESDPAHPATGHAPSMKRKNCAS